jgi:hypothetical protein
MLGLLLVPTVSSAHALSSAAEQAASTTLTIAPGGTASFTARGFCLDFGKPFPDQAVSPKGLADDKIRAALDYSIQKGYTTGSPDQVELAIWNLRDGVWRNDSHVTAQEIVDAATTATPPASTGDGMSIVDAVSQNKVSINATFVAQTAGHFYGDATVELTNTTNAEVKVFLPVGTTFAVPGSAGTFQDLAVYILNVVNQAPTAEPTNTAQPTNTVQPTSTTRPTQQATAVPATSVPQATATRSSASPTARPAQAPSTLPQTGAGEDGSGGPTSYILYAALALALILCGAWLTGKPGARNKGRL